MKQQSFLSKTNAFVREYQPNLLRHIQKPSEFSLDKYNIDKLIKFLDITFDFLP
jgi:hypothetical protein